MKKGSQKYRELLLIDIEKIQAPKAKIERDWKISEKPGREFSMRRPLASGKTPAYQQKYNLRCSKSPITNSSLMHKWHIMQEVRMGKEFNQDVLCAL